MTINFLYILTFRKLLLLQSEERGKDDYSSSEKTQDTRIARSAGNSLDKLAGSSGELEGNLSCYTLCIVGKSN